MPRWKTVSWLLALGSLNCQIICLAAEEELPTGLWYRQQVLHAEVSSISSSCTEEESHVPFMSEIPRSHRWRHSNKEHIFIFTSLGVWDKMVPWAVHTFKVFLVTVAASIHASEESGPREEKTALVASEQSHKAHLLHVIAWEAQCLDSLGGDKRCSCSGLLFYHFFQCWFTNN